MLAKTKSFNKEKEEEGFIHTFLSMVFQKESADSTLKVKDIAVE